MSCVNNAQNTPALTKDATQQDPTSAIILSDKYISMKTWWLQ
jgi:hypothetical protein